VCISEAAFCWWLIHICQDVNVLVVFPYHCCGDMSYTSMYIKHFSFSVVLSKIIQHSSVILSDSFITVEALLYKWLRWSDLRSDILLCS
jgi:hypothetical protein